MENQIKVGFLCPHNPHDQRAFSGTSYYSARALGAVPGVSLRILGPFRPLRPWHRVLKWAPPPRLEAKALDLGGLDAVVGMVASRFIDTLLADHGLPFVHVTDSTPSFQRDFYGRDFPPATDALEARVIHVAARTAYSSHFMAERAIEEFGVAADRLAVVPFGVNFGDLPAQVPAKPSLTPLRLLYVGTDWTRKGGDVAVQALEHLRRDGMDVELTVVGPAPAELAGRPGVRLTGYLDKNRPADLDRFRQLFSEAHLFVLPTRADCTPMVVAEANAHGTPVLITDIGGIATLMDEGRNGRMLPGTAGPEAWAGAVRELTADPAAYAALSASSFEHAHRRLTWEAWARGIVDILGDLRGAARDG